MRRDEYNAQKLAIYEAESAGEINVLEKCKLIAALESKKNGSEISKEDAEDALEKIASTFPDLEDDVEKLLKKLKKAGDSEDTDSKEEEDSEEDSVEEACNDLLADMYDMFG